MIPANSGRHKKGPSYYHEANIDDKVSCIFKSRIWLIGRQVGISVIQG